MHLKQKNTLDLHGLDDESAKFLLEHCKPGIEITEIIFGKSSHSKVSSIGAMKTLVQNYLQGNHITGQWKQGSVSFDGYRLNSNLTFFKPDTSIVSSSSNRNFGKENQVETRKPTSGLNANAAKFVPASKF